MMEECSFFEENEQNGIDNPLTPIGKLSMKDNPNETKIWPGSISFQTKLLNFNL